MLNFNIIIITIIILIIFFFIRLNEGFLIGYPEVISIRNPSYDLRGDPYIIPKAIISPWNQSTIYPNPNRYMILI